MTCGGLKGCPTTMRSGCVHLDCMTLGVIPDELEAMSESGGVASSISANSFILKSGRSGPFSCTKSALDSACFISAVKARRSRLAPGLRPVLESNVQSSRQVIGCPTRANHARTDDCYVPNLLVLCHVILLKVVQV